MQSGERISSILGLSWAGRKRLPEADALLYHAYSIYKAQIHEPCGQPLIESTDDANEDAYEIVDGESTCHACAAWDRWREDTKGRDRDPGSLAHLRFLKHEHGDPSESQAALLAAYKASQSNTDS